uniref:Uncharacterized protein n=1 Tax=Anguilla anguilla TaxID=7936 RepID=A0A0E9RW25_ANGAN
MMASGRFWLLKIWLSLNVHGNLINRLTLRLSSTFISGQKIPGFEWNSASDTSW